MKIDEESSEPSHRGKVVRVATKEGEEIAEDGLQRGLEKANPGRTGPVDDRPRPRSGARSAKYVLDGPEN